MNIQRAKPATETSAQAPKSKEKSKRKILRHEDYSQQRDYSGALTVLEFQIGGKQPTLDNLLWMAYYSFHIGEYEKAKEGYLMIIKLENYSPEVWNNLACCYFYLGMYKEADEAAQKGPKTSLQNRIQFHLAHKFSDSTRLDAYHRNLQNSFEDQLCLAAMHYLRSSFQNAIDIYKKILSSHREYYAINVYVALSYYKYEYYDISQEVLAVYLDKFPDSITALNLKACNYYRLYNGKAAEAELNTLKELISTTITFANDLLEHNVIVFRSGANALQTWPRLLDVLPEARLNLVIYYLKQEDYNRAFELIQVLECNSSSEIILKGIVNLCVGQEKGSRDHLKLAQKCFQSVGTSELEIDTIPGRQCMASCYFMLGHFNDVLVFLNTIKSYFYNDDTFNFNFAQAQARVGKYKEAEEVFLLIRGEKLQSDYVYISWLARCYIMNRKANLAWQLYIKMETSTESFSLLQLIANECYKMGQFYYSAKAFDVLERLDPNPEYWEGKRGACVGLFQMIIAGHEPREHLKEVILILRNSSNLQVDIIVKMIGKWAKDNRLNLAT